MLCAGPFAFCAIAQARIFEVGPGHAFAALSALSGRLHDGDTVRIFPGRYASCAVLQADRLTVEGVGDAASVVLAGSLCAGKAILVADGRGITIRSLTLAEAWSPDGNGAGIRAEGGDLTVESVRFIHDQDGILTSDTAHDLVLRVRNSVFERDGACVGACAHAIYAGHIAQLRVEGSAFLGTREGHAIKSRAARTEVTGCDITDGPDGTGSYLIEAPDGGAVLIQGNRLEKGRFSGNGSAIAIGTEAVDQPTPYVAIMDNRFTNDSARRMIFVLNRSVVAAALTDNTLKGLITPLDGRGAVH